MINNENKSIKVPYITLVYSYDSNNKFGCISGHIKRFRYNEIIVHNKSENKSVNFNKQTKRGKILTKSNQIHNIIVKGFRVWESNSELHILLPSEYHIRSQNEFRIDTIKGITDGITNGIKEYENDTYNVKSNNILISMNNGNDNNSVIRIEYESDDWNISEVGLDSSVSRNEFNIGFFDNNKSDRNAMYIGMNEKITSYYLTF